jgi:hypothetical protein
MSAFFRIFSLICLMGLSLQSFAQEDEVYDDEVYDETIDNSKENEKDLRNNGGIRDGRKFDMKNAYIGSGVGLDFWGSTFSFHMSPHIGYRIGYALMPAVGMTYTYIYNFFDETSTHIYGPKALIRIRPLEQMRWYLHAEGEYLRLRQTNPYFNPSNPNGQPRFLEDNQPRVNVGLGYASNLDEGAGFMTEFLFDVYWLQTRQTYLNPITYRIGFYYGF